MTWDETLDSYERAFGIRPGVGPDTERVGFLRCLWEYASELVQHPGLVVEIGTYQGKSTLVMACALIGTGSRIVTIDPVFSLGEWTCPDPCAEGRVRYASDIRNVIIRWSLAGVSRLISVIPLPSTDALIDWPKGEMIDLLVVDGEHTESAVVQDSAWSRHVCVGGHVAYDDWIEPVRNGAMAYFSGRPNWELCYQSTDKAPDEHPEWSVTLFRRTS